MLNSLILFMISDIRVSEAKIPRNTDHSITLHHVISSKINLFFEIVCNKINILPGYNYMYSVSEMSKFMNSSLKRN